MPKLRANLWNLSCNVAFHHQGAEESQVRRGVPGGPPQGRQTPGRKPVQGGERGAAGEPVGDMSLGRAGIKFCQETRPWPCGSPSEHLWSPRALPCSLAPTQALISFNRDKIPAAQNSLF